MDGSQRRADTISLPIRRVTAGSPRYSADAFTAALHRMVGRRSGFNLVAARREYPAVSRNRSSIRSHVVWLRSVNVAPRPPNPRGLPYRVRRRRTIMLAVLTGCLLWHATAVLGGGEQSATIAGSAFALVHSTLFILVPQLLAASVKGPQLGDVGGASICGALGILCIVMAPGALGRCDPPHVLLYGMGVSMLLMIRLANISWRAFAAYAIAYGLVFIFLINVVNLLVFYGVGPKTVISRHPLRNLAQRFRYASGTGHPDATTLSALDRYPRLGLPFASFGDAAVEKYVVTSGKLDPEYYVAIVGVYSPAALERKLRDVGRAEYFLVPNFLRDNGSPPNPCGAYLKGLRQWFLYPAKLPCRADPLDPFAALKSFIADHYTPVERVGSWWVLRRISSSPES